MTADTAAGMNLRYTPPPANQRRSGKTWFLAASSRTRAMVSNSDRPGSRSRPLVLRPAGTSTSRSSREFAPSASSISRRSAAECTRYGIAGASPTALRGARPPSVRLPLGERPVACLVEQALAEVPIELDPDEPSAPVRVLVDLLGFGVQALVDLEHRARDGRIEVGGRLHGLHHAEAVAGLQELAHARELEEDDVAELRLGEVGDPDRGDAVFHGHPLVRLGVVALRHALSPP